MASFLISLFTVVLVLASLFMVFIVLLQRGSQGGAGTAFGGGMAESAFGGDTNRVLTRATVTTAIVFFIVGLGLYLGQLAVHNSAQHTDVSLDAAIVAAETKANASQVTKAETPKPGETTAEALKILAAETKEGAKAEDIKKAVGAQEAKPAAVVPAVTAK